MCLNQIQQRKKEYPDDVDQVPIKSTHLHRCEVTGTKMASGRAKDQPRDHTHAGENVKAVQTGQEKVDAEEQMGLHRSVLIDRVMGKSMGDVGGLEVLLVARER